MSKDKRTFCDCNDEIRSLLNDVINEVSSCIQYQDIGGLYTALDDLNKISELTNETQDQVDAIENRLKLYRNTIENLGFERKK